MEKINYEKDFKRLQEIVAILEDEQTSLAESLSLFNEALQLYSVCRKAIDDAKLQVDILVGDNKNDN